MLQHVVTKIAMGYKGMKHTASKGKPLWPTCHIAIYSVFAFVMTTGLTANYHLLDCITRDSLSIHVVKLVSDLKVIQSEYDENTRAKM